MRGKVWSLSVVVAMVLALTPMAAGDDTASFSASNDNCYLRLKVGSVDQGHQVNPYECFAQQSGAVWVEQADCTSENCTIHMQTSGYGGAMTPSQVSVQTFVFHGEPWKTNPIATVCSQERIGSLAFCHGQADVTLPVVAEACALMTVHTHFLWTYVINPGTLISNPGETLVFNVHSWADSEITVCRDAAGDPEFT